MSISKTEREKLVAAGRSDLVDAVDTAAAEAKAARGKLGTAESAAQAAIRDMHRAAFLADLRRDGWAQVATDEKSRRPTGETKWARGADAQYAAVKVVAVSPYGLGFDTCGGTYRLSDGMQKGKRAEHYRIDINPIRAALGLAPIERVKS